MASMPKDIIGHRFGRLTVISVDHKEQHYRKGGKPNGNIYFYFYLCRCTCGKQCVKSVNTLRHTKEPSCGCADNERMIKFNKETKVKHGYRNSRLYREWQSIKGRCYYKGVNGYKNYGGRGITVCDEWKNDFIKFKDWALNNGYHDTLTIDRIDVNGNYSPENCRWVDKKQQSRNMRTNDNITYNGETHCLTEWAEILNISRCTLYNRIHRRNWTVERAFTEPIHWEKRRDNNGSNINSSK